MLNLFYYQGSSTDRSQWREPTRTSECLCSLYEAAFCLFEEVRSWSSLYLSAPFITSERDFSELGSGFFFSLPDLLLLGLPDGFRLLPYLRQSGQYSDWWGPGGVGNLWGVCVGQQQQPPAGGGDSGKDPSAQVGCQFCWCTDGMWKQPSVVV